MSFERVIAPDLLFWGGAMLKILKLKISKKKYSAIFDLGFYLIFGALLTKGDLTVSSEDLELQEISSGYGRLKKSS